MTSTNPSQMPKVNVSREWLEAHKKGYSRKALAQELGVSESTMQRYFDHAGIERVNQKPGFAPRSQNSSKMPSREWLEDHIEMEAGEELGISHSSIDQQARIKRDKHLTGPGAKFRNAWARLCRLYLEPSVVHPGEGLLFRRKDWRERYEKQRQYELERRTMG